MGEFHIEDLVSPGTRVGPTEDPKVCFNLLVDMFCFTVGLGMIDCGKGEVVIEEFFKFLGKGRGELWATIRDYFVIEPETEVYFVKKRGQLPPQW